MKKKLLFPVVAVAFALTVLPTLARERYDRHHRDQAEETTVETHNYADVDNTVVSVANTGLNAARGNEERGIVRTGNADTDAVVENGANDAWTEVETDEDVELDVDTHNHADVDNTVVSVANSGLNSASSNGEESYSRRTRGHHHSDDSEGVGVVETGNAFATARVANVVNTTTTKVTR